MMDKEKTLRLAKLAHLELTDNETASFTGQLGSIISCIDTLGSADTAGIEPLCFIGSAYDPLRDDVESPSLPIGALLSNAPLAKKGHFAVPKIIGGAE